MTRFGGTEEEWAVRLAVLGVDDPRGAGLALLVPVDVQALVVTGDAETVPAAVGVGMDDPARTMPFTDGPARAPGVHLHWAMPDGLGRGTDAGDRVTFPALPDRWLVARFGPGASRDARALRLWLLDAAQGVVQSPEDSPVEPAPAEQRARLTVTADADPAWAAVYDNVAARFGMHDDLADVPEAATLSYAVAGWYSAPDLDPVAAAGAAALDRYGWALAGRVREDELRRLVCHGALIGVRSAGPGKGEDARPDPTAVTLGLGATEVDALAGLLSADLAGDLLPGGTAEDVERLTMLLTALGLGRLAELDDPEGLGRLEEAVHAAGFETVPGAPVEEVVALDPPALDLSPPPLPRELLLGRDADRVRDREPERFPDRRRLEGPWWPGDEGVPQPGERAVADAVDTRLAELGRAGDRTVLRRVARGLAWLGVTADLVSELRPRQLAALLDWAHHAIARVDEVASAPRTELRRHPGQPFFLPRDPALVLRGAGRSLRHGDDGRFDPERGRLLCRTGDQVVTGFGGIVDGSAVLPTDRLVDPAGAGRGGLLGFGTPPAALALLREVALLDPYGLDALTATAGDPGARGRLAAEQALAGLHGRWQADLAALDDRSTRIGFLPSPVGWQTWQQPWVPVYLEWEITAALDHRLDDWQLAELDLDRAAGAAAYQATVVHAGRSLLDAAPARRVAAQAAYQLAQAGRLDSVRLTAEDSRRLGVLATDGWYADLLVAGLDGLVAWQLGFRSNVATVDPSTGARRFRRDEPPELLRAGQLCLTRLRVVDAFCRTLDLAGRLGDATVGVAAAASQALRDAEPAGLPAARTPGVAVPARIVRPARIALDVCDQAWNPVPDYRGPTPEVTVAGWLLPDRVDTAVEVFSPAGAPLGQLRQDQLARAVLWEPPPGTVADLGAAPAGQGDPDLAAFLRSVVTADLHDRSAGAGRSHSPLEALLRVIDLTLWTVAPASERAAPTVASLTGIPIAVLRARLRLDAMPYVMEVGADETDPAAVAAAEARLAATAVEVRLGALTRRADSVVGYAPRAAPTEFRVVHPSVLEAAGLDRPDEAGAPRFDQPFVSAAPLRVRPGEPIDLLLFLDPAGAVTLTTGLLPRAAERLPQRWLTAMPRLRPSFRFGPVLVDPHAVLLPAIAAEGSVPAWTHRDAAPDHWEGQPIVPGSLAGRLPLDAVTVQDGWIVLRPSTPDGH